MSWNLKGLFDLLYIFFRKQASPILIDLFFCDDLLQLVQLFKINYFAIQDHLQLFVVS